MRDECDGTECENPECQPKPDRSNDRLNFAAGTWQKFDPNPVHIGNIREGEWCLWSMIIDGQRNYFSGSWFTDRTGRPCVQWQGSGAFWADDGSVYWARVNHVEI